ncbi:cytochrome P450 [Thermomonospora cellulosilytica]|uniref:Cytochrome P450 n=1 Tax=Thermomonospora cellulosilytica TaxID=1411118 RepID=A0A7W3RC06_9ACTN|nr:cytochrome P450 [Thermomonospora cellulosilytica]MBA9007577.1 cytochrome P450 [Thermomonospora cellulosilytica]
MDVEAGPTRKARSFPLYRTLPGFLRDPLEEVLRIARTADGEVVRLDLGASRPFLVTHPDHVQQVLRRESDNFLRIGTFWQPLHGLFGDGIMSEGEPWERSKRVLQPVFTARNVNSATDRMAEAINDVVARFDGPAREGRPLPVLPEMSRIVNETVIRVLFGGKITQAEADRLIPAMEEVAVNIAYRFLLPFVPHAVPLPGDRAFRRGVQVMDETLYALVERFRNHPGEGHDIFTALCQARLAEGGDLDDTWVRDNLLAMFATSTETTTVALSWLWPLLAENPPVEARLREEIDRVVGGEPVRPSHLGDLVYVKQVIQELLRLYPVGWIFPRQATRHTVVGGVPIKPGQTVLISPFLTHRLPSVWADPLRFDPDRFAPEQARRHHRYAYFPFGGGPHQCIGRHVFNVEAQLILTAVMSRYHVRVSLPERPDARIGATLRPKVDFTMTLEPAGDDS